MFVELSTKQNAHSLRWADSNLFLCWVNRCDTFVVNQFPCLTSQTHQEQGRSYKEVCAPVIERLRFLFNELRPAVCSDLSIMSKFKLLGSLPRWRRIAQKIIRERRKKRGNDVSVRMYRYRVSLPAFAESDFRGTLWDVNIRMYSYLGWVCDFRETLCVIVGIACGIFMFCHSIYACLWLNTEVLISKLILKEL